jgi:GNAT superfamily N-acetyltransferase
MVNSHRELTIRELRDDEEFGAWLRELTTEYSTAGDTAIQERHLVLTDEIGDWIGGLRYLMRGGVAQILEIGVRPEDRGQGFAIRLLEGFEAAAREHGAHLIEFWTDKLALEPMLAAFGWQRVLSRPGYIAGRTWHLLEKRVAPSPGAD